MNTLIPDLPSAGQVPLSLHSDCPFPTTYYMYCHLPKGKASLSSHPAYCRTFQAPRHNIYMDCLEASYIPPQSVSPYPGCSPTMLSCPDRDLLQILHSDSWHPRRHIYSVYSLSPRKENHQSPAPPCLSVRSSVSSAELQNQTLCQMAGHNFPAPCHPAIPHPPGIHQDLYSRSNRQIRSTR